MVIDPIMHMIVNTLNYVLQWLLLIISYRVTFFHEYAIKKRGKLVDGIKD